MSDEVVGRLVRQAQKAKYRPGELILRFDGPADRYFLLETGSVRIFERAEDGSEVVVRLIGAPATFGEVELITGCRALEWVDAIEACEILEVPRATFLQAMRDSAEFCRNLLDDVATRFASAIQHERSLAFDPGEKRLARLLSDYVRLFGLPVDGGTLIRVPLTQAQLADAVGLNRRTVIRILATWTEEKRIRKQGRHFVVCDEEIVAAGERTFSLVHKPVRGSTG